MTSLSTHVLDTALGRPAAGVRVELTRGDEQVATAETNEDGRASLADELEPGVYRMAFSPPSPFFTRVELEVVLGDGHYLRFVARFEEELAPQTVAAFRAILPFDDRIIHCRWSGESNWIPWGDRDLGVGPENATSYPHPWELALYPGGVSETELLFPYGYCNFASKAGQLAANHFATLVDGKEQLRELGRLTLWEGAQPISFRELG